LKIKPIIFCIPFLLLFIVGACSNNYNPTATNDLPQKDSESAQNEFSFRGSPGTSFSANLNGSPLNFQIEEIRDNRCPVNANCIIAGAARVILSGSELGEFVLCTGVDCRDAGATYRINLGGTEYDFVLEEITPYPTGNNAAEEKEAIFKIRRVTS
jgi:hypothetical protein